MNKNEIKNTLLEARQQILHLEGINHRQLEIMQGTPERLDSTQTTLNRIDKALKNLKS